MSYRSKRRKICYVFAILSTVSSIGCLTESGPIDETTLSRTFGTVVFSRNIGDISYFRHKVPYSDLRNFMNPFITVVREGRVEQHKRLNEIIDYLVDNEVVLSQQQATLVKIEAYGVSLGDNIQKYDGFKPVSVDEESRLVNWINRTGNTGWDVLAVKATKDGIIEEIDLLKEFVSLTAMKDFQFKLEAVIASKYVRTENEYIPSTRSGFYVIYGVSNSEAYRQAVKVVLTNELQAEHFPTNVDVYFPYVINDRLNRISAFYTEERKTVWLSITSKNIDVHINKTNEDILKRM
jgi:hypothetical protein